MIRSILISAALLNTLMPIHEPVAFAEQEPVIGIIAQESEAEMPPASSFSAQNEADTLDMLAKTVWGEARGLDDYEKSMVVWCIFNRLDHGWYGETIEEVVTAPYQFAGYDPDFPVEDDIRDLCEDVLTRWKNGEDGRTLPYKFVNFTGDGKRNYFTDRDGNIYDFSAPNPYGGT